MCEVSFSAYVESDPDTLVTLSVNSRLSCRSLCAHVARLFKSTRAHAGSECLDFLIGGAVLSRTDCATTAQDLRRSGDTIEVCYAGLPVFTVLPGRHKRKEFYSDVSCTGQQLLEDTAREFGIQSGEVVFLGADGVGRSMDAGSQLIDQWWDLGAVRGYGLEARHSPPPETVKVVFQVAAESPVTVPTVSWSAASTVTAATVTMMRLTLNVGPTTTLGDVRKLVHGLPQCQGLRLAIMPRTSGRHTLQQLLLRDGAELPGEPLPGCTPAMSITIATWSGEIMLGVAPSDTIGGVKQMIHAIEGILEGEQRLMYAGVQLEDGRTLSDYKILNDSTLKLVKRSSSCPIYVKTLKGGTTTVFLEPNDMVEDVKQKISDKEGLPVSDMRLVFAGMQLDDGRKFSFYKIGEEPTLQMLVRLRGD